MENGYPDCYACFLSVLPERHHWAGAMESRHCELLEKNRDKFIQTVDIDVLLPYFQATNLVSPADVISIATQTTKQTKITKFFDILCDNTSPQVFHTLCTALESTYPHLLTAMFLGASDGKKPLHSNNKTSNNHYSGSHGNSGSHSNSSPHGAPPHGTGVPHSASHSSHAHSHSHSSHSGTSTISTHSSSSQNPLYDSHAIPKSRSSGSTSRSNSSASKGEISADLAVILLALSEFQSICVPYPISIISQVSSWFPSSISSAPVV